MKPSHLLAAIVSAIVALVTFTACGKIGVGGHIDQMMGNWAPVNLPEGCQAKMIAADNHTVAVLCEDGRVFH